MLQMTNANPDHVRTTEFQLFYALSLRRNASEAEIHLSILDKICEKRQGCVECRKGANICERETRFKR